MCKLNLQGQRREWSEFESKYVTLCCNVKIIGRKSDENDDYLLAQIDDSFGDNMPKPRWYKVRANRYDSNNCAGYYEYIVVKGYKVIIDWWRVAGLPKF